MGDLRRVAMVGDKCGQRIDQAKPPVGTGQQQNAAIGTDPPAVERGGDLLLADTWQRERQKGIVGGRWAWQILSGLPELASAPNLYAIPDGCTMPTSKSLPCG